MQIEKASMTSPLSCGSPQSNRGPARRCSRIDLAAVCAEVFDFYEPLAESKIGRDGLDAGRPFRFAATKT